MDEKLPYTLLPRKSSNELHGYGYYRRQRFNYRYPVRGRKPSITLPFALKVIRFNYRYPVRGRKQDLRFSLKKLDKSRFNYRYPVRGRKHNMYLTDVPTTLDLITVTP